MGLYDRDYGKFSQRTPWDRTQNPKSVTTMLIIVTAALWFVDMMLTRGTQASILFRYGAVSGETLFNPLSWFQFLTYGFLHDTNNPLHLGMNMLGLFIFGRVIEPRLGRGEFLRFYLLTIVMGGIIAAVWAVGAAAILQDPSAMLIPTIGASGAVVAVVILFACYHPDEYLLLFFILPVKAWMVAVGFVAFDLAGAIGLRPESSTAFQVHLTGAALAYAYYKLRWNLGWLDPSRLGGLTGEVKRRSRAAKLKLHDPDQRLQKDANEADRILAKIHREGEQSLSDRERKTLERYSRRQRERRDRP